MWVYGTTLVIKFKCFCHAWFRTPHRTPRTPHTPAVYGAGVFKIKKKSAGVLGPRTPAPIFNVRGVCGGFLASQ